MSLEQVWEDEPTILGFRLYDQVVEADLNQLGKLALEVIDAQPLYFLISFTDVDSMPRNLINAALRSNALVSLINHTHTRWFVFIAPNQPTRLMIETVFRGVSYTIVDSRERGLALLREEIIPDDMSGDE
jgi:hypothetical protein